MLDKTTMKLLAQRIVCIVIGKDNGENIMKSILKFHYKMGTFIKTPARRIRCRGALQLGPRTCIESFTDLSAKETGKKKLTRSTNILVQVYTKKTSTHSSTTILMPKTFGNARGQTEVANVNPGQAKPIKCYNCNRLGHIAGELMDEEQLLFLVGEQVTNFDDDVDDPTEKDLALITMFMVNLSSEDPIYDEAGPSYDSNTPFEVQDHDTFVDHIDEYHEYMEDNEEHVVQSNVSSVRNDALMSIIDDMHEQGVQIGVYEKRTKFELTEREQKIDEQMRIIISDRNRKETSLKSELHTVQMQLRSTVDHNKSMKEEVTTLKKDFKQKEDKYIEEFLDIKKLKENVEDRLFKQDQSIQMVHIPAVVHDSEETLKITELTRIMYEKMKNPQCIQNKAKDENDKKKAEASVLKPLSTPTVYVVPTGKDNFIVSAGRPNMVPAGRTIVSPGSIIFGPGG
ncbi:hypothetical protein Tco_0369996 [Tanacetum coccineum]